jgi:hypothetical protein
MAPETVCRGGALPPPAGKPPRRPGREQEVVPGVRLQGAALQVQLRAAQAGIRCMER